MGKYKKTAQLDNTSPPPPNKGKKKKKERKKKYIYKTTKSKISLWVNELVYTL